MSSRLKKDALRLLHVPSRTVFQNFPASNNAPFNYISAAAFSPHSGYFSVGNDKGRALLYRLNHYEFL